MDSFRVSHLPLVRDGEYLGLISDDDVYDLEMEMCNIGENIASFKNPFIRVNQHVFEVVQKIMETKVTVLPVLEMDDEYYGSITINDLALYLTELVAAKETGAIIVLELNPIDYSLSQIAQIVESNDAKVISLYTKSQENTKEMDVTLKVNVTDVSSIIQTFVRYDYNIKAVYMDDSLLTDMYSERYELFMKYMDI